MPRYVAHRLSVVSRSHAKPAAEIGSSSNVVDGRRVIGYVEVDHGAIAEPDAEIGCAGHGRPAVPRFSTLTRIELFDEGTDEALWATVAEHLPRLGRFALGLTGSPDAADDLVAEAIARTLPKWRTGNVAEPVAYVRRVMVNQAARRWRRREVSRRLDHHAHDWQRPSNDATATVDDRDRTLSAVLTLPVRRRAIVLMRFYDDLPIADIARQLDIREGTVKSQLSRALDQLREQLQEQQ